MNTFLKSLMLAACLVSSTSFVAQTVLNLSDLEPSSNTSYRTYIWESVSSVLDPIGDAGADAVYGFGLFDTTRSSVTSIENQFSAYKFIEADGNERIYEYTDGGVALLQSTSPIGITVEYSDAMEVLKFPLAFPSTFTDDFAGERTFSGGPVTNRTGTITVACDGTGILYLPGGTVENVLRVKTEISYTDETGGFTDRTYHEVTYRWYAPSFNYELASYTEFTLFSATGGTTTNEFFTFRDVGPNGIQSTDIDAGPSLAYPNPATTKFIIDLSAGLQVAAVEFRDIQGRMVNAETILRNEQLEVDVTDVQPGYYLMSLQTSDGVVSRRIVVQ